MKSEFNPRFLLVSAFISLGVTANAAPFIWDGTDNTWTSPHWNAGVGGPTGGSNADSATINGGTVTFSGNDTFGNNATGASPVITINNGGTLASGGFFNTMWDLTLNGGTLLANGGAHPVFGAFKLSGTVTIGGSSASNISLGAGTNNNVTLGATDGGNTTFNVADVTNSTATDLTISTVLSTIGSPSGLIKTGAGTMTLTAANTYNGNTLVNAGTLVVDGGTIAGPGIIDIGANAATPANFTLNSGNVTAGGQFVIGAHGSTSTAAINGGALQINGTIYVGGYGEGTGTGTVTQTAGTVTTTGGIDFGGGGPNNGIYNLNGGTLTTPVLYKNNSGTAIINFNGGTLRPSAANANFLQGFTAANVLSGGAIIDTNGFDIAIAQPLLDGGGGGLTKAGNGTLTLTGANTYTGGTLVNAGTLVVNGGTIAGPGIIDIGANAATPAHFTLNSGNVTAGGQFVIGAHGSTGTATINGGVLQVNGSIYIGGYGEGTGTGTITQSGGTVTTTGGIDFGGGGPNNGIYNLNGGTLTTPGLGKNGSGSTTINFNGGTLRTSATNANFLQNHTAASVLSGGALIDTNGFDITIAQPLLDGGGGGGLTKNGTGTLTLSGANTYTGATDVSLGKLIVGVFGTGGSLTSNVAVASGATVGGSGTITGNVSLSSGGSLAAGNSPGILTVNGTSTFNSGSIFSWELNSDVDHNGLATEGNRGTHYDGLTSTNLSVASGAIFRVILTGTADLASAFWDQAQTWNNIFSVSGSTTEAATGHLFNAFQVYTGSTDITTGTSTAQGSFTMNGSTLTWTAVPEPSSALAGLLVATGLFRRRR